MIKTGGSSGSSPELTTAVVLITSLTFNPNYTNSLNGHRQDEKRGQGGWGGGGHGDGTESRTEEQTKDTTHLEY